MKGRQQLTFQAYKSGSAITIVSLNMLLGYMCSAGSISSEMILSGSLRRFGRMGGLVRAQSLSSLAVGRDFTLAGWRNGFLICRLLEWIVLKANCGWARERAGVLGLSNCCFRRVNALELSYADGEFDIVLASRLFTILPEQNRAVAEMYRVLKPGGHCFIAEPRHVFRASIPLFAMWLLAGLNQSRNGYREPYKATVFSAHAFENLFPAQPWKNIRVWQEGRYQYALCEKA